jgi:hypothetical protein
MSSSPCNELDKRGESPWGLNIGNICNETNQGPTDGGGVTWCALHKKKHLSLNEKKG